MQPETKTKLGFAVAFVVTLGIIPALYYTVGVPDISDNETSKIWAKGVMFALVALGIGAYRSIKNK